jgi:hypothetical protein
VVRRVMELKTMRNIRRLPTLGIALIATMVVAGAAGVAVRIPEMNAWATKDLIALVVLIGATVVTEGFSVKVGFGDETKHITLTEASYAAALLLGARPGVLTVAVAMGVGLSNVARGVAPHKAAYSVASYVVAMTGAEVVYGALHGVSPLGAVSAAMVTFFALNASTVVAIIAIATGRRVRHTFGPIAAAETSHLAGNLAIGVFAAAIWTTAPVAMPTLIAVAIACSAAYRLVTPSAPLRES